ncbi:MAG TPA: bifunctional (p)ppGpp synthetase/guanosine-3',5'-bis(diphosphate) 3'-pyrophosphohydrolase [Casimicrobiaceae bacterium]|jgi:GTP pyrophosphokinase|nr:bifunctional (p)ppGpp synthetase/guanosine-3',5'-bis(diphosphate) 3'-pyrophosphohydrolase [Casimicrobiaceae bacterium]
MVSLARASRATSSAVANPEALTAWLDQAAAAYSPGERVAIAKALDSARDRYGSLLASDGELWLDRALGTAGIVASLKLDATSVVASLLLGLPDLAGFDAKTLEENFGQEIAQIVVGVARMGAIRAAQESIAGEERDRQAENLRKMLLAMVEDIRVVLIKLAERTQALRFLIGSEEAGDRRAQAARETLDLFAPLANRLGVGQLKWELEDLSLRALEPEAYQRIARLLDERRLDRQHYIETVQATLKRELAAAGVKADVSGRAKHIYSIWNKMRRKGAGIESLYDIRAVRILVDEVKDCYAALGVVHNLWSPVPREFDDYIAKPKPNDYRSLHTAVMGPEGKPLEVQIRTYDMHRQSEYGVAAHWRYKEAAHTGRRDPGYEEKIAWLRQVLDWKDAVADAGEWLQQFKSSLFTDTIYVLTPQGKVIDLPRGATPVDFAYSVHTSLGHRCRGARVDGAMVPLNYKLASGQRVEIIAVKGGPSVGPSRDWLNPELGYVTSHRARSKVRQWFKAQQVEETIAHGRDIVERELARAGLTSVKLDAVAAEAGYAKVEEFFAAVARVEINLRALQTAIRAAAKQETVAPEEEALQTRRSKAAGAGSGILVVGVDRLMTGLAKCCKPAPPDPIVGFVTRGKGISIHRQSCSNVARMKERQPERLITADWGKPRDEVFPVDVVVEAMDRQGLLRDISEVFSRERINVTAVNTLSKNLQARMGFTLEVRGLDELKRALLLVREVPGVLSAARR